MSKKTKVAIIGGGIVGCSVAYYLSKEVGYDITVFERLGLLGDWETGKSVAMVMQQTGDEMLSSFAKTSLDEYGQFNDEDSNIGLKRYGSILYTTNPQKAEEIERRIALQCALGIETIKVSPSDIKNRIPLASTDDIICGCYCPSDGYINCSNVVSFLHIKSEEAGVKFRLNCDVQIMNSEHEDATNPIQLIAKTSSSVDEILQFDIVVNACGGLAHLFAKQAGETLSISNNRRRIAVVEPRTPFNPFPILEDIDEGSEWYIRPYDDETTVLFGEGPTINYEITEENKDDYPEIDADIKNDLHEELADYMSVRMPSLEKENLSNAWLGVRSYAEGDKPIIRYSEKIKGLIHCCGMSGFGVSIAPACGMKVVELVKSARGYKND